MAKIYGTYYQSPDDLDPNGSFGSGACSNLNLGGGIILITARSFLIRAPITASGLPVDKGPSSELGGSGGYIYMKQLPLNPLIPTNVSDIKI
jgi:hypothetical protein